MMRRDLTGLRPGLGLLALSLAGPAAAHDLWLLAEPSSVAAGASLQLQAATGMRFPESLSAVTPDRLENFWVLDAAGGRHQVSGARAEGKLLRADVRLDAPGVALAALAIKPRTLELSASDFNDYLEHDGLPQILERRRARGEIDESARESYAKYAKAILTVGEGGSRDLATRPAGLRIEIVPLRDPGVVGAGEELPVQVLFEGRPLGGVYVYALAAGAEGYGEGHRTDEDGRTTVPLPAGGLMSLHCIHMRPHADAAEADWESFFATVTFVAAE
jgi:uncharacterized GH25 family protein